MQCSPGIHDILHHDHLFSFNYLRVQARHLDVSGTLHAFIGPDIDKRQVTIPLIAADQFGTKHEGPFQYDQKEWFCIFELIIDALGNGIDFGKYLFL